MKTQIKGTHGRISAIVYKGDNVCDFLCALKCPDSRVSALEFRSIARSLSLIPFHHLSMASIMLKGM